MRNITVTIDEKTLEKTKHYADSRGLSVSALIRELLERTTSHDSKNWAPELFAHMDRTRNEVQVTPWSRDDLYDV